LARAAGITDIEVQDDDGVYLDLAQLTSANNVLGGTGADSIVGFAGADILDGNDGIDTLILNATSTDLNRAGDDQLVNIENIDASNSLSGVLINLAIQSGENFNIVGGSFADTIAGGLENDILKGGAGADRLAGGDGNDIFKYTTRETSVGASGLNTDVISDFATGVDKISLERGTGSLLAGVTLGATSTAAAFTDNTGDTTTTVNSLADVYAAIAANTAFSNVANFAESAAAAGANQISAKTISFALGAAAGTYLVVNDSTAGFQASNDLVVGLGVGGAAAAGDINTFA